MKSIFAIACSTIFAASASAADVKIDLSVPFSVKATGTKQTEMSGAIYTVVILQLDNGPYYLKSVEMHCEARNANGNTWDVSGKAMDFAPKESRQFRLVSNGDPTAVSVDARTISCAIKSFETGLR